MFSSTPSSSNAITLGANAILPPIPMTQSDMEKFRKNPTISSALPDLPIHNRCRAIVSALQKDTDPDTKSFSSLLESSWALEDTQLELLEKLLNQLWTSPVTSGHIKWLHQVLDIPNGQINKHNYFAYLNNFYLRWEETLKVAMVHHRRSQISSARYSKLYTKVTWSAIEEHIQQFPEGKTVAIKKEIELHFAQKAIEYTHIREQAERTFLYGRADATPSSSSSRSTLAPTSFHKRTIKGTGSLEQRKKREASEIPGAAPSSSSISTSVPATFAQATVDTTTMDLAAPALTSEIPDVALASSSSSISTLTTTPAPVSSPRSKKSLSNIHTTSSDTTVDAEAACSAPPMPNSYMPISSSSSTDTSLSLTMTPEISPSAIYQDHLLIDTQVTLQGITKPRNPVHVIFIVDVSGSMKHAIKHVHTTLIDMIHQKLRAGDIISIITFASKAEVVVNAKTLPNDSLATIIKTNIVAQGTTNILAGFEALKNLTPTPLETHAVVLTDGGDDIYNPRNPLYISGKDNPTPPPRPTREEYTDQMIKIARDFAGETIRIHAVGMTTNIDQEITSRLSNGTLAVQLFIKTQQAVGEAVETLANYISSDNRAPAGYMTVTHNGLLQHFDIPSVPFGNPFPILLRFATAQIDVTAPVKIEYHFPDTELVTREISISSVVENIDSIAADIINRYERLIATPIDPKTKLAEELYELVKKIRRLKTDYPGIHNQATDAAEQRILDYLRKNLPTYLAILEKNDKTQTSADPLNTLRPQTDERAIVPTEYDISDVATIIKAFEIPIKRGIIDITLWNITHRYDQLIETPLIEPMVKLKNELLGLLVEVIQLKTNYPHASWGSLDNAERKIRDYLAALESNDQSRMNACNVDTLVLKSIISTPSSQQTAAAAPTLPQASAATVTSTEQQTLAPLNYDNAKAHIAHARQRDWGRVVFVLQVFEHRLLSLNMSPDIKLLLAIENNNITAIHECFSQGLDPLQVNSRGWSWVMQALCKRASLEIIKILVEQYGVPLDVLSSTNKVNVLTIAKNHLSIFRRSTLGENDKLQQINRLNSIIEYLQTPSVVTPSLSSSISFFPSASTSTPTALAAPTVPNEVPESMICPVNQEIMKEPVVVSTGISYEKEMLVEYFKHREDNNIHPIHLCPLGRTELKLMGDGYFTPNLALKALIDDWNNKQQHPARTLTRTP